MRGRGLLIAALAAIVVGIIGLVAVSAAVAAPDQANGWGFGHRGGMGMPGVGAMMGGPVAADARPIGMERAASAARDYVASFDDPDLELGEVMEFAANYYAQAMERDTGIHAFELLIDRHTGAVFPEPGPNMVWNTRYGHMGGMMGRRAFGQGDSEMPVGPERAQELARQYLETQGLRLEVAEPDRFYGYYTLHTLQDGEIEGMLSVNGFTGEIWYHAWHGPFIQAMP